MLQLPESQFILDKLRHDLPPALYYHTVSHTLDVYEMAKFYAEKDGVSGHDLKLLLMACLFHDSGYLFRRDGHEALSCEIAADTLPQFGYSGADIQAIREIVMATKIPQRAKSHLEKIICDADLDYLGRDDFFEQGNLLYREMLDAGDVSDAQDWNRKQIDFLKEHRYFTPTAQSLRNAKKQENLNTLEAGMAARHEG